MKTKLQVDIWTETREQIIITRRSDWRLIWCDRCFDETFWFSLPAVTGEPVANAIARSLGAGRIHHTRSGDGRLSICLQSLGTVQNAISGETK